MERPPEILKLYANRLSRMITAEERVELTGLLRLTGLLAPELMTVPNQPDSPNSPNSLDGVRLNGSAERRGNSDLVGIWERRSESGKSYFVRSADLVGEWGSWASVGRIGFKGAKRRIVLVGESVARGYLYDP